MAQTRHEAQGTNGQLSLEEAIQQRITLGMKDPLEIARNIGKEYDQEWLVNELLPLSEDVIAEIARRRLGAERRGAHVALRPGDAVSQSEMRLRSVWVPGAGGGEWKRVNDLTRGDVVALGNWYMRLASASTRRAAWCADVADLMKKHDVPTLGDLPVDLPTLPDAEPLALIA